MRIYLASDIHVEFHKSFTTPSESVDVVVLAGDIHTSKNVLAVAAEFHERCKAPVILVLGNHEFYGTDYVAHLARLRAKATAMEGIHLLERESLVIGDVRFLGCTLWSNFELHGHRYSNACMREALLGIADFSSIKFEGQRFLPEHAAALFRRSYDWLEAQLATPFSGQTVVISHFLPHRAGIHRMHAGERDFLTAYFTADCSDLMDIYPIDIWMHGHTHNSIDLLLDNGVRLVSNMRGYPNEPYVYTQFNPEKIIKLDADPDHDVARRIETSKRQESRKAILSGTTWLTAHEIAKLAGRKIEAVEEDLADWEDQQAIFSIHHEHLTQYPDYLLDPGTGFYPYPDSAQLIRVLFQTRKTNWQLASWFEGVNGRLGGIAPKDLMASDTARVLEVARLNEKEL